MKLTGDLEDKEPHFSEMVVCVWKTHRYLWEMPWRNGMFSTFRFRQNDSSYLAGNSLFFWISGIIGTSEKKGGFPMPQSEMEALL